MNYVVKNTWKFDTKQLKKELYDLLKENKSNDIQKG